MKYKENALDCEDYLKLRESVGWINFSKEQAQEAINNSLYTVIAIDNKQTVGMGRLVGDGMYGMIVDLVVEPNYQKQGIGSKIVDMLMNFVEKKTPIGGRCSIQLIAEKGKEAFYEERGFKRIPHEFSGSGMRKVIYR